MFSFINKELSFPSKIKTRKQRDQERMKNKLGCKKIEIHIPETREVSS